MSAHLIKRSWPSAQRTIGGMCRLIRELGRRYLDLCAGRLA